MTLAKYPEIGDLNIGQSVFIPIEQVGNLPTLRSAIGQFAARRGIRLSVHKNRDHIEIARQPSTRDEAVDHYVARSVDRWGLEFDDIARLVDKVAQAIATTK